MTTRSEVNRGLLWLVCSLGLWWSAGFLAPQTALAQADAEEKTDEKAEAPAKAEKGEKAAEGEGETASHGETSLLWWVIETSGWIGAFLLVISIYFVSKCVQLFMELRPEVVTPVELVEECERLLVARDFTGILKVLKADKSFFATVSSAGLHELPNGLNEARDIMERVGEVNTITMEKKISLLAVLGTLGPMIGLLGTLKGMIASFSVIATSDAAIKPSEVAGGISEALVLTFEGVGLSVPAIYLYSLFRNRVSMLSTQSMMDADSFIRRINTAIRSKTPGAAPARQAAATE